VGPQRAGRLRRRCILRAHKTDLVLVFRDPSGGANESQWPSREVANGQEW